MIEIKLWKSVLMQLFMLTKKDTFAALKRIGKENFLKKNRKFVVTELVKTRDELVIDQIF